MNSIRYNLGILFLLCFNAGMCCGAEQIIPAKNVDNAKQEYLQIIKRIECLGKTESLEELEGTSKAISLFYSGKMEDDRELKIIRTLKLKLLLSFLNNIDKNVDKSFNVEKDVPQMNIDPGSGYDPGVSPDLIKDPIVKKKYEEAIKKNSQNIKNHRFQLRIRRVDNSWTREIIAYIKEKYSISQQDVTELNNAVDTYILDNKRKEKMKMEINEVFKNKKLEKEKQEITK